MNHEGNPTQPNQDEPVHDDTAWANYGYAGGENEDFIVGSREGLMKLREHIDRAIETGESIAEEPGIEFNGVRRIDDVAKGRESEVESWKDTVACWGCSLTVIAILVLACIGLLSLFHK